MNSFRFGIAVLIFGAAALALAGPATFTLVVTEPGEKDTE